MVMDIRPTLTSRENAKGEAVVVESKIVEAIYTAEQIESMIKSTQEQLDKIDTQRAEIEKAMEHVLELQAQLPKE